MVIHTAELFSEQAKELDKSFPQCIIRSGFINHVLGKQKKNIFLRKLITLREYILWPIVALWYIFRERPDLVHIGEHNFASIGAYIAKKVFNVPYIYYTYAEEITILSKRKLHNKIFLGILRSAERIVTVSHYTLGLLTDSGVPQEKIRIILPSVSDRKKDIANSDLIERVRNEYNLGTGKVLLTVGSLERRKGHASVIRILHDLLAKYPDLKYVIIGGGREEYLLHELVETTGLHESVVFTGRISDNVLNAIYQICDIFVMPHRQMPDNLDTEGCPTVFLEAGSHKKAVIGGNAGGVSDAIIDGETGFIIDGTNEKLLFETILRLLEDRQLADRMGKAGCAYASTLTPKANAEKMMAVYEEVLAQRGR